MQIYNFTPENFRLSTSFVIFVQVRNQTKQYQIMANRRTLKKDINYICNELLAENVAISLYKKDANLEDVNNALAKIIVMQDDFIRRISHTEPGNAKKFYARLKKDFNAQVEEIIQNINGRC